MWIKSAKRCAATVLGRFFIHGAGGIRVEKTAVYPHTLYPLRISDEISSTRFLKEISRFISSAILSQPCITVV